jgi:hypothetical protein
MIILVYPDSGQDRLAAVLMGLERNMTEEILPVRVVCYAGYRDEETPRYFYIGDRRVVVTEVLDSWLAPEHRYFKVCGNDSGLYILRHDVASDRWELTMFATRGCAGHGTKGNPPAE